MIFITQNIGQDGKLVAFLDQAHGDTGNVVLDRNTGIHQCKAATANRSHRGRTVGFHDFGNQTDGIAEFFL